MSEIIETVRVIGKDEQIKRLEEKNKNLHQALVDIQKHQFIIAGSERKARMTGAFNIAEKAMNENLRGSD